MTRIRLPHALPPITKTAAVAAALLLAAPFLSGCATTPKKERKVAELPPGSFQVEWALDTHASDPQNLYYVGGLLFVYDKDNTVSCYDGLGGLKFRTRVGDPGDIVGTPVVQPNRIIFPTSGSLYLYTPTGVKTKQIDLNEPIRSPAVAQNEVLYVGSDSETGGRLAAVALDRSYNYYVWTRLTGIVHTQPVLHDNVIFCATEDGRVYAVTIEGDRGWAIAPEIPDGIFHTDGNIVAPLKFDETTPKVEDQGVYVASTDTKLYCLNPTNGHVKWQYYAGVPLTNSPAITADLVYQRVEGQGLVALTKKTAERVIAPKWTFADGSQLLSTDAQNAYVLGNDGAVLALKKADGTVSFKTQDTKVLRAVTNLDPKNAAVYALTKDKQLVCLRPVLRAGVVGELALADGR